MIAKIDRAFGEHFLTSIDDFYAYGVDKLFNDWWATAPADAIQKYVDAIENHPEQAPLARERWYAEPFDLASLAQYGPGTLGHAYHGFMVSNDLMERLAQGYREFHEQLEALGKLDAMPPVMKYKVLRGFQTHDLHHVLTGYPATPFGELALQAFQLAQMDFPYSAMWIAVITGHMALIDPLMIKPVMDAITDGWAYGRRARSIQFVKFETMLDRPIADLRREYRLDNHRNDTSNSRVNRLPELLYAS
jgi:ubiquinone biosynthesis protein COQ4